jgi:hypothetical protein
VEGIKLSAESREMFAEFDRRGLSNEERRKLTIEKHQEKP